MAKVQLIAFNSRLRSDYMDWPDSDIGHDIFLMMDLDKVKINDYSKAPTLTTVNCRARFVFDGTAGVDSKGEMIYFYRLVEVYK